jgi:hypothetical protein
VAVSSYLPDVAGGMVAAASFADDAAARQAIETLIASDVLPQEISVIARDEARSARIAGDKAWYPGKGTTGPAKLIRRITGRLPREVRKRYAKELAAGKVVVVAAAGGQPSDTLAALLSRSGGSLVDQWWQTPADLFAPPELAGPF